MTREKTYKNSIDSSNLSLSPLSTSISNSISTSAEEGCPFAWYEWWDPKYGDLVSLCGLVLCGVVLIWFGLSGRDHEGGRG